MSGLFLDSDPARAGSLLPSPPSLLSPLPPAESFASSSCSSSILLFLLSLPIPTQPEIPYSRCNLEPLSHAPIEDGDNNLTFQALHHDLPPAAKGVSTATQVRADPSQFILGRHSKVRIPNKGIS
eukprot:760048-Hanusia_phi.AAC.1